jgi:hypothetical protein
MATKKKGETPPDELRDEYDVKELGKGVRGKYLAQARKGTNLVLLDPDVARAFPTQQSVNEALRMLVKVAKTSSKSGERTGTAASSGG